MFSQVPDFQLSNDIPLRAQDEYQGLIHSDSSGYLLHIYERSGKGLLGIAGRNLILEKYDKNLTQEFSYAYGESSMISLELISLKERLIWIVMEKTGSYDYSYSMIPIELDGKQGKKNHLFDIEVNKAIDIPHTYMRLSPDSSSVAFIAEFDADKKRRKTDIYSAVISDDATIIWDKTTTMRGNQKQYEVLDYQLNSDNELLMLAKYFKNESGDKDVRNKRGEIVPGYELTIFKIRGAERQVEKFPSGVKDIFISDAMMEIYPSGEIYCAGLTSDKNNGNINGVYFSSYDKEMNTLVSNTDIFNMKDLIFLSKASADVNLKKKNNQGLDDEYELCDIIRLSDGGVVVTAEENYVRSYNSNFNNGTLYNSSRFNRNMNESIYLNSNDIVAVKLVPDGSIQELNIIPKKQSKLMYQGQSFFNPSKELLRESDLHLSHDYMLVDDNLMFFYNEHRHNIEDNNGRRIEGTRRMETAIAAMDTELSYDVQSFLGKDAQLLLSPRRSKQISSHEYFVTLVSRSDRREHSIRIGILEFR